MTELTVLLISWLWLMISNAPGLLRTDYWWAALILGCAGLAFTALFVWLWFEVCRFILPGGDGWPTAKTFRSPGWTTGLTVGFMAAVVFKTLDYIYCWVHQTNPHWLWLSLAVLIQTLALLIPLGFTHPTNPQVAPVIHPSEPISPVIPTSGEAGTPEIGFERFPQ